jgi:hypothetical protein
MPHVPARPPAEPVATSMMAAYAVSELSPRKPTTSLFSDGVSTTDTVCSNLMGLRTSSSHPPAAEGEATRVHLRMPPD